MSLLFAAGHLGAMVTQSPRYQITRMGEPVTLTCSQDLNHDTMSWYQQKLSQAPKLLLYYYDQMLNKEPDTSDNFQPSRHNTSFCSLGIRSPSLGDSAVYLCASSRGTEREHCAPSAHKPAPGPRTLPRPRCPPTTAVGSGCAAVIISCADGSWRRPAKPWTVMPTVEKWLHSPNLQLVVFSQNHFNHPFCSLQ